MLVSKENLTEHLSLQKQTKNMPSRSVKGTVTKDICIVHRCKGFDFVLQEQAFVVLSLVNYFSFFLFL